MSPYNAKDKTRASWTRSTCTHAQGKVEPYRQQVVLADLVGHFVQGEGRVAGGQLPAVGHIAPAVAPGRSAEGAAQQKHVTLAALFANTKARRHRKSHTHQVPQHSAGPLHWQYGIALETHSSAQAITSSLSGRTDQQQNVLANQNTRFQKAQCNNSSRNALQRVHTS